MFNRECDIQVVKSSSEIISFLVRWTDFMALCDFKVQKRTEIMVNLHRLFWVTQRCSLSITLNISEKSVAVFSCVLLLF